MSYYNTIVKWYPMRFISASGAAPTLGVLSIDLNAAAGTTSYALTVKTPMIVYEWGAIVAEVVGTQTTTKGIGSISYTPSGGSIVEIGTITVAGGEAVDTEILGTLVGTAAGQATILNQRYNSGDILTFKTKTQAVGGTVTGDLVPFLYVEFFPVAP